MMKLYPQQNLTVDKRIYNYIDIVVQGEFRKTFLVYLQIDGEVTSQLLVWNRKLFRMSFFFLVWAHRPPQRRKCRLGCRFNYANFT